MNRLFLNRVWLALWLICLPQSIRTYDPSNDRSSLSDDFLDMNTYSKSKRSMSTNITTTITMNCNVCLLSTCCRIVTEMFRNSINRPSLFHVVKFPNDECHDLSNQSGTCYTPLQCKAFGGTGTAGCAKGYGTCCIS